jgi:phage internal scaffolding protein
MTTAKQKNILPFKTPYPTTKGQTYRVSYNTIGESLTQQHHKDEADIHNIIAKYDTDGVILNVKKGVAQYGDFSTVTDYHESLRTIQYAQENFLELPSDVRKQFDNDAGKFFDFASNPDNLDELVSMGLATKPIDKTVSVPPETPEATPSISPMKKEEE